MEKKYYEEYFDLERRHWWFQVRNRLLMERIAAVLGPKRPLRILNIGAGTCATSELLARFGEVVSVEYDEHCVAYTRGRLNLPLQQGTILAIDFPDQHFDLVCAFDVIEHVDDDGLAVREMKRVCKPGGLVAVSVPAFQLLWSHHDVVNHHFRRYTMPQLVQVFEQNQPATGTGGSIVYRTYFNSALFLPIAAFRLASKAIPKQLIRHGTGADNNVLPTESPVNKLLYGIFDTERKLINGGLTFPFGVSAMLLWQMGNK